MRSRALTAAAARRAGAQIGAPRLAAGAGRLRERLAMPVGAGQPAEIRALSRPALVTKNVIALCWARALSATPQAASAANATAAKRSDTFIWVLPCDCSVHPRLAAEANSTTTRRCDIFQAQRLGALTAA